MTLDPARILTFATPAAFAAWLATHHAVGELWVRIYAVGSGIPSLTLGEAVVEALAWGWIDGFKRGNDDASWFQRFTPRRRPRWSQVNRAHAERLIAAGRMQEAGLREAATTKADARWDAIYARAPTWCSPMRSWRRSPRTRSRRLRSTG